MKFEPQNDVVDNVPETVETPTISPLHLPIAPEFDEQGSALLTTEVEPEAVVEAAEQLLREGAPHDFDVIVVGAGPGGTTAALECARGGLHTALIEAREVGGTALNRGGVASKALLESASLLRSMRRVSDFGIESISEITPNFAAMQRRKNAIIARLRDKAQRDLEKAGVEILHGHARFFAPHTLEIEANLAPTRRINAIHIVVAVGGIPARLQTEGADLPGVVTSDEILQQSFVPTRLVIAGAGALGVEFATLFASLGSQVTVLEKSDVVLPTEDSEIQKACRLGLERMGVSVETSVEIESIRSGSNGSGSSDSLEVFFRRDEELQSLHTDQVLLATGRVANLEKLDLDKASIDAESGKIDVDENHQTVSKGVYAIGDCIRRVGWTNQAELEGREVAATILGTALANPARFVPACYFSDPEIATVGLTLEAASELGIEARSGRFPFIECERALLASNSEGFLQIVFEMGTQRLLGCQIIGPHASELINEVALALRMGMSAKVFCDAMHAHPTFGEALGLAVRAAVENENR